MAKHHSKHKTIGRMTPVRANPSALSDGHGQLACDDSPRKGNGQYIEPLAVTIPDARRLCGLSRSAIYRCISAGDIVKVKAGRRSLILMTSLRTFLDGLPAA